MMGRRFLFFLAIMLNAALVVPLANAKEVDVDRSEAIERAITAQGGKEQGGRLLTKSWRAGVKGTAGPLEITGRLSHHGPEKG